MRGATTYADEMTTTLYGARSAPHGSLAPEHDAGTTLAPSRPDPELDDGDHDRMAHIVLEGYTPKVGDFRALCGKEWVPGRNPRRYGLCPTCKEIAESKGWKLPAN